MGRWDLIFSLQNGSIASGQAKDYAESGGNREHPKEWEKFDFNIPQMVDNQLSKAFTIRDFFVFLVNNKRIKATAMYEKALLSLERSLQGEDLLLSQMRQETLRSWIDEILPRLTSTTVDRYVESLQTIYK